MITLTVIIEDTEKELRVTDVQRISTKEAEAYAEHKNLIATKLSTMSHKAAETYGAAV